MRRRDFIKGFAGSAAAGWPIAARAQNPNRVRRLGVLMAYEESNRDGQAFVAAFREALAKLGWVEGVNVRIDIRWAMTRDVELRERFAKELVALQPDLILAHGTPSTATLLRQSRIIPIVFVNVADPIGSGFVTSFPNPGGIATGFMTIEPTIAGKWLELLKEIAPSVARCALLFNPVTAPYVENFLKPFKDAAAAFAIEAIVAGVRNAEELQMAIIALAREPNSGVVLIPDTFMTVHRATIVALTAQYSIPAVYPFRSYTAKGGLLSYGGDTADNYRRSATYADRILRGDKPSELPVQAPVKFELVINLRAANALGLTVPPSLFARADDLIE